MLVQCDVDPGFRRIDYDGRELRKTLRKAGSDVRRIARKLISKRAVSEAGEFPGKQTGEMAKSIRVHVSRSGYSVSIHPTKTSRMPAYYPAFVVYGHRAPHSETKEEARAHKARSGKKVAAPRKNFIVDAATENRLQFERDMYEALSNSIKPGVI